MWESLTSRRRLLQGLATGGIAAVSGCSSVLGSSSAHPRVVSLDSQDSVPPELDLEIDVDLVRSRISAEQTARVQVVITNTGSEQAINVGDGIMCGLFGFEKGESNPKGLWLFPTNSPVEKVEDRWVVDRPTDEAIYFNKIAYDCSELSPQTTLQNESSIENEYQVWHDYRVEDYLAPGTYRWEAPMRIWNGQHTDEDPAHYLEWGFSLTVQHPESGLF